LAGTFFVDLDNYGFFNDIFRILLHVGIF
jgi:hypothetical protein